MDIRNPEWFAQLTISGTAEPMNLSGSVQSMLGQILLALRDSKPRALANGKEVVIRFSDRPFDRKITQSLDELTRAAEESVGMNGSEGEKPRENDTYDTFYDRLVTSGISPETAKFFADDWFGHVPDAQLQRWMADPRVARFNELQLNKSSFEAASRDEYGILREYIKAEYPERASQITFKTL